MGSPPTCSRPMWRASLSRKSWKASGTCARSQRCHQSTVSGRSPKLCWPDGGAPSPKELWAPCRGVHREKPLTVKSLVEKALLSSDALTGSSLDLIKFYNMVPRPPAMCLMQHPRRALGEATSPSASPVLTLSALQLQLIPSQSCLRNASRHSHACTTRTPPWPRDGPRTRTNMRKRSGHPCEATWLDSPCGTCKGPDNYHFHLPTATSRQIAHVVAAAWRAFVPELIGHRNGL